MYWLTPEVPATRPSENSAVMVAEIGMGSGSAQLVRVQRVPSNGGSSLSAPAPQPAPSASRETSTTVRPRTRLVRFVTLA